MDLQAFSQNRICVAVSGGVDSVCLLHYLNEEKKRYGFSLSAVHCEHGIRGEDSLADMQFVKSLCDEWGIELFVFQADCPQKAKTEKCSLETAARNFRYDCFARLVAEGKTDYVATAHHQSDVAETVLFRLLRGSALKGAVGIKEKIGFVIRPLLCWSKAEILAYAEQNALSYRVDSTNLQTDVTRNKLRLAVFPLLEEAVDGATENLARFASIAAEDEGYLQKQSETLVTLQEKSALVAFCSEKPLFRRACLTAMQHLGVDKDYTYTHLQALFDLQALPLGSMLSLPKGVVAEREQAQIVLQKESDKPVLPTPPSHAQPFAITDFDGGRYVLSVSLAPLNRESALRIDVDKMPEGAVFRFRREGDYIQKFGGDGKSLKKFLNERKIPKEERPFLPLIAQGEGDEVFVVGGEEISQKLRVDENTKRVAYIVCKRK